LYNKIFNRIIVLLIFNVFIFGNVFAKSEEKLVLTLETALKIAKDKNKDMLIAEEEIRKAGGQVREAWSGALPQITMNSVYNRNILKPAFFLTIEDETQKIEIGQANSYQNIINFNQPVWLGGKVGTALKIAKAYDSSTEYGFDNSWDNVKTEVKKTFYAILLTKEAKRVAEMTLKHAEAHYENVKKLYKEGQTSEFDLLRAEVNAVNFKPPVIQADNNLQLSYASLKNLLSIDIDQEIDVEGTYEYEPLDEMFVTENNKLAIQRRPDLKQLEFLTEMQKLNVKIERADFYPNVYLTGAYQFQGQSNVFLPKKNQRANSVSAGFSVQFNLFDGLRTYARVMQAEADYQKMEYQKMKLIDGISLGIKQAVLKMKEARQLVDTQAKNVVQAEKALKIADVRYSNGIGTQLELFDAQIALETAHMGYIQGIYNYNIAKFDWEKAVGM